MKYSKKWIFKNGHDDARARAKKRRRKDLNPFTGKGPEAPQL